MLILNAADLRAALPMMDAIPAVRWAYAAFSAGTAVMPPRLHLAIPGTDAVSLCMPAFLPDAPDAPVPAALIVKAVSVFPANASLGLKTVQGAALVLDPATGECLALLDGAELTAIRTGAGSGVATDLLARPDGCTLAIIGTGAQALTQVQGICAVRPIQQIRIFGRDRIRAERFAARLAKLSYAHFAIWIAGSVGEALRDADIVCTATTASEALFKDTDLKPGAHINAVGAFRPDMWEVPAAAVLRSRLFVDSRAAALKEAGDIVQAIEEGVIGPGHITGEIGELIDGRVEGRRSADEVTLFKSVGMAVQDAASAAVALANAQARGIGQRVSW